MEDSDKYLWPKYRVLIMMRKFRFPGDFDEFEYDYLKTENNEVVVHTFTVKDEAVLGALEELFPIMAQFRGSRWN